MLVTPARTETAELILALTRQIVSDHLTDDDAEPVIRRARNWLEANAPELLTRKDSHR